MNPYDDGTGPDDRGNNTMAAVLIGVAVVIGIVLLAKGLSQEGGIVETAAPNKTEQTTTTTQAGEPGGVDDTTTTTVSAARNPADVSVMVANGSGAAGVAGTAADELKAAGYKKVDTTNAAVVTTSAVYYDKGYEADAKAVAAVLKINPASVAEMPASPPAQLGGASVLVVIGPDRLSTGASGGSGAGGSTSGGSTSGGSTSGGSNGGTTPTSTLSPVTR